MCVAIFNSFNLRRSQCNTYFVFITEHILEWLPKQTYPCTFDSRAVIRRSIIIASHNDTIRKQIIPGKLLLYNRKYYGAYNEVEYNNPSDNVFYLVYNKTAGYTLRWIKGIPGLIPSGAVDGGRTDDGYPLYVGWSGHSGAYDARKDCLDVQYWGCKCLADYDLLVLTSKIFANKFNFNFLHSQFDHRYGIYRIRIRNDFF